MPVMIADFSLRTCQVHLLDRYFTCVQLPEKYPAVAVIQKIDLMEARIVDNLIITVRLILLCGEISQCIYQLRKFSLYDQ